MRVAILGATGHIAQAALFLLSSMHDARFFLFSRNREKLAAIGARHKESMEGLFCGYANFTAHDYDLIVNGIGLGSSSMLRTSANSLWRLTEEYDDMIISYLEGHPEALFINFSSGAVYGNVYTEPVREESFSTIPVNALDEGSMYTISKLASEAKHRSFPALNIVDLRIFGFYSRFIDLSYSFFLCEVVRAVQSGEELITSTDNIMRDYIHLEDFRNLLLALIKKQRINTSIDVRSREAARKFALLEFFRENYGLRYRFAEDQSFQSLTGLKMEYCSLRENPLCTPERSALDAIRDETRALLGV